MEYEIDVKWQQTLCLRMIWSSMQYLNIVIPIQVIDYPCCELFSIIREDMVWGPISCIEHFQTFNNIMCFLCCKNICCNKLAEMICYNKYPKFTNLHVIIYILKRPIDVNNDKNKVSYEACTQI